MKRKFLPLLLTVVLVVAAAIVPMLTLTASAAETTGTISFASTAQRVSQDSSSQVWSNDGITFTNNKASSSTAVGNYSNPVRIYAGSNITFEAPGNITEIVVACSSASYATVLVNSVGSEATASGSDVTITPTSSATTYTIAKITAQTRFKSVTVTYEVAGDETCEHANTTTTTVDATCTEAGSTTVTCDDCGKTVSTEEIAALGHNYVDGVCTECGKKEGGWELLTNIANLQVGDQIVIVASGSNYALSTTQNTNNRGTANVTKSENTVTFGDDVQILTIEAGTVANTFALYTGSGYLYAASSGSNYLKTQTTKDDNGSWTITVTDGVATIKAQGANTRNWLRYNSQSSLFSCYASGQADVSIYVFKTVNSGCAHENTTTTTTEATCTVDGITTVTCNDCGTEISSEVTSKATGHSYGHVTTEATCTEAGSIVYTCSSCQDTYSETIPALGHNYVNGTCDVCGEEQPNESTAELSFATTDNRTSIDDEHQIWQANGLVFVNNKANSTTKVANYAPVRLYKSSSITITAPGYISKIVFNCTDTDYLLNIDGAEVDGTTVTINLDATSKSFTIDALSGQVRLNSISVTYNRYPSKAVFSGASLTLGTNLAMNYFVTLPKDGVIDGYSVKFTLNGVETVVDTYTEVNGEYVFTLAGIGPQNYQDKIVAELVYNGVTVRTKDNYSVEDSLNGYAATESTKELANATLAYCAAAKAYVSDEITSTEKVEGTVAETGKSITNNEKVTAVGVNFDYVNKIYVKLNADATVTFNGVAADVVDLGNGVYIAYSDALTALQFNNTVTIKVDDTTVTYSVNAYAYTIYTKYATAENLTEKQLEMYNLAVTLYKYGDAAYNYAN